MSEEHISLDDLASEWANAAHSIFGPSQSAMYLICSGSLIPHLLAKDEPSYEAAEGTVAHSVADLWLRTGTRPDHLIGVIQESDGFFIEITEIMLGYVEKYINWCREVDGDHYYETRTDISSLTPIPGQQGTADHFVCNFGRLTITDLKYGEGVKVYAADDKGDPRAFTGNVTEFVLNGNTQALLYAIGVFLEWDWFYHFDKITIRICQPRLDHFDVWETTREDLLIFAEWAKERMKLAWVRGAPRTPSKKGCRWCRVEKTCPAFISWTAINTIDPKMQDLDAPQTTFSQGNMLAVMETISDPTAIVFDPVDPAELTIEQIANLYRYRPVIEGWFRKMEKLLKDVIDGDNDTEVPFWKVVEGISRRKFADPDEAAKQLDLLGLTEEQIWPRHIISPAQAETILQTHKKLSKRKAASLIEDFVVRPPGPRTLAQLNDRREALPLDGDRFEDLDADPEM